MNTIMINSGEPLTTSDKVHMCKFCQDHGCQSTNHSREYSHFCENTNKIQKELDHIFGSIKEILHKSAA